MTDEQNHRVQKFHSNGNFITKWGTGGNAEVRFELPTFLSISPLNIVYVSDTGNHRIQGFALEDIP